MKSGRRTFLKRLHRPAISSLLYSGKPNALDQARSSWPREFASPLHNQCAFRLRHATEWLLPWWSCDVTGEPASKKFMSWGREKRNTVSKYHVAVPNQSQRAA
jgi:hypothetical protein